ncbi:MAG: LicD family protein [Clostridiaceae bacterium]
MDNDRLVRLAQMDLLLELKRICHKCNINYFLAGGTLLGAIRHQGFIPWDDDIDVGMLRKDYDKFIKACYSELDSDYGLYDWNIDKNSPAPFLKMKIKGTHYVEYLSRDSSMNDEIYIDIFPFDNAPDSIYKQKMQAIKVYLLKKILLLRCGFSIDENKKIYKSMLYKILLAFSKIHSVAAWKKRFINVITEYNSKDSLYVVNMCGAYSYKRSMREKSILEHFIEKPFEGHNFPVPENYHRYLSEVYGDYMKLPPEAQRVSRHGILNIDLNTYKIRSI